MIFESAQLQQNGMFLEASVRLDQQSGIACYLTFGHLVNIEQFKKTQNGFVRPSILHA